MIDKSNYKYWLVYSKHNRTMNICEVFAENEHDAITECLESYNYDGIYTEKDLYAVCHSNNKSLLDKMRIH